MKLEAPEAIVDYLQDRGLTARPGWPSAPPDDGPPGTADISVGHQGRRVDVLCFPVLAEVLAKAIGEWWRSVPRQPRDSVPVTVGRWTTAIESDVVSDAYQLADILRQHLTSGHLVEPAASESAARFEWRYASWTIQLAPAGTNLVCVAIPVVRPLAGSSRGTVWGAPETRALDEQQIECFEETDDAVLVHLSYPGGATEWAPGHGWLRSPLRLPRSARDVNASSTDS